MGRINLSRTGTDHRDDFLVIHTKISMRSVSFISSHAEEKNALFINNNK